MPREKHAATCTERRFRLSHAQVQMARELGMNPRKLGKLDNHEQEPWKAPLPQFIEQLYRKRFGRDRPENVMSIEDRARAKQAKQTARKQARRLARAAGQGGEAPPVDQAAMGRASSSSDGGIAGGSSDDAS